MTNDPGDRPDDENPNPFKGTPFEQIFNASAPGVPQVPVSRGCRAERAGCRTCPP